MPSISDLEMFVKVVETGNMSAAGRELGLSPAVVSKHISALEEELKSRLFERTTRHLSLTECGEHYHQHVLSALKELHSAEKAIQERAGEPRGTLKITSFTNFGRRHLMPILGEFLEKYQKIDLDITLTDEMIDIVSDGFDIAIRIGVIKDNKMITHALDTNERVLCAHPNYLAKYGTPKSLKELEHHNCLLLKTLENWILQGPNGRETIKINGNLKSNSSDFILEATLRGQGIALRSKWEIRDHIRDGSLRQVLPDYHGSNDVVLHIIHPHKQIIPAKVEAFVSFMKQKYKHNTEVKTATYHPVSC